MGPTALFFACLQTDTGAGPAGINCQRHCIVQKAQNNTSEAELDKHLDSRKGLPGLSGDMV